MYFHKWYFRIDYGQGSYHYKKLRVLDPTTYYAAKFFLQFNGDYDEFVCSMPLKTNRTCWQIMIAHEYYECLNALRFALEPDTNFPPLAILEI